MSKVGPEQLTELFLYELLHAALRNDKLLGLLKQHLKPKFIPDENLRKIWQHISLHSKDGAKVSYGRLTQKFKNSDAILEEIENIRNIDIEHQEDEIVRTLEEFIRQVKYVELFEESANYYNKNNFKDAYRVFARGIEDLSKFSLRSKMLDRVFADFQERQYDREFEAKSPEVDRYVICGIDELDEHTGGFERGELVVWLGDSGAGKTTLLVHIGKELARRRMPVFHYQLEGTKRQILNRYDAAWTGTTYFDMKRGEMSKQKLESCLKIVSKIGKGEVYVESVMGLTTATNRKTVNDLRNSIIDLNRSGVFPAAILVDYLELLHPSDNREYSAGEERHRQTAISRELKNLAVEFDCVVHAPTQASAVPPESKKNPNFVMTRWNLSEDKGKIRAADAFITMNFTPDEYKEEIMRLYGDKFRESAGEKLIYIAQKRERMRFYDRKRTINELYGIGSEESED